MTTRATRKENCLGEGLAVRTGQHSSEKESNPSPRHLCVLATHSPSTSARGSSESRVGEERSGERREKCSDTSQAPSRGSAGSHANDHQRFKCQDVCSSTRKQARSSGGRITIEKCQTLRVASSRRSSSLRRPLRHHRRRLRSGRTSSRHSRQEYSRRAPARRSYLPTCHTRS